MPTPPRTGGGKCWRGGTGRGGCSGAGAASETTRSLSNTDVRGHSFSLQILGVDPISKEASHGSSCQTGHAAWLSLSPVSPPRPR